MKVYLFDDGTIESKLLKHDSERNKEIQTEVIKTEYNPKDIARYLDKITTITNDLETISIHFHFCKEDFLKYDIDTQRNVLRSQPKHRFQSIFFAYEFLNKDAAVSKAQLAGIELETKQEPEPEPETKKTKKNK